MKKISVILMSVLLLITLTACGTKFMSEKDIMTLEKNPTGTLVIAYELDDKLIFNETFEFELYYNEAPNTVTNFISLVNDKFYDGLIFHRYETTTNSNRVLQGGGFTEKYDEYDDRVDLIKKELKYTIAGEYKNNGWARNTRKHENGSLVMARTDKANSASSQFYVSIGENKTLDDDYAVFGKITENTKFFTDLADEVKTTSLGSEDHGTFSSIPVGKLYIKSITVNTHGVTFKSPIKIK